MDNDIKCIKRVLRGETEYFRELVDRYQRKIFCTCFDFTRNEQDAHDLVQEVFIKVYNNLGQYKSFSSFSTWIYKVCVNTCLNFLKKNRHLVFEYADDLLYSPGESPEGMLEAKEIKELLEQELDDVGPRSREIFATRIFRGAPFRVIAGRFGGTEDAARKTYSRVKKRLHDKVEGYYKGE